MNIDVPIRRCQSFLGKLHRQDRLYREDGQSILKKVSNIALSLILIMVIGISLNVGNATESAHKISGSDNGIKSSEEALSQCETLLNYYAVAEGVFEVFEARGDKLPDILQTAAWRNDQEKLSALIKAGESDEAQCKKDHEEIASFLTLFGIAL